MMRRVLVDRFDSLPVLLPTRDGAGAERVAIRLAPCKFERVQPDDQQIYETCMPWVG